MNALRFAQKGAIESVLKLEQVPKPSLAAGEALVRVKAAGINGVRSIWLTLPALFRYVSLTVDCDSPIALGSKVGFPSPLCPVFLAAISLEKLSTFSTSLPRSGLGRRFGGLGVPGVLRSMGPTQSEFLSAFASAHFAEVQLVLPGLQK